jgi:hypothetical protein
MLDDVQVAVSFDPVRGYVATHPQLAAPVIALSLSVLHARVAAQLGNNVHLKLDRLARQQRDERLRGSPERATGYDAGVTDSAQSVPDLDDVC